MSRRGDHQRAAVYRWEAEHVHPKDTGTVPFDEAQAIVNYVWARAGLTYPPKIRELARTARRTTANADRLTISIPATGASAVLVVLNGIGRAIRLALINIREGPAAYSANTSEYCRYF